MTVRAQQTKPTAEKGVQPKVLPNAHTRMAPRHDKYERQADEAARRMLRGETNLARMLTPAPAASYKLPSSSGDPLSGDVREWLERGFGANLSGIRVHRDHPADAALRSRYAEALTSGWNIFIRPDKYDPRSDAGKELMAHEVAHVLQQTGRAGSAGVAQLSLSEGGGPIQFKRSTVLKPTDPIPDFDTICKRHGDADTKSDANLKKAIAKMKKDRSEAVAKNAESAFWDKVETLSKAIKAGDAINRKAVSFVFDCLKSARRFDAAASLLTADKLIRTCFFSAEMYESVPEDVSFLGFLIVESDFFKAFPSRRFEESVGEFLFGPTRSIPALAGAKDLRKEAKTMLDSIQAPTGLIPNELFMVTVWAYDQADQFRIRKLAELVNNIAPGTDPAKLNIAQRRQLARSFAAWANKVNLNPAEIKALGDEPAALLTSFLTNMAAAAENAAKFWDTIADFDLGARLGAPRVKSGLEALERAALRYEFGDYRDHVLQQARFLFELPAYEQGKMQLPSAQEYAKLRDTFVQDVAAAALRDFELKFLAELEAPKRDIGLTFAYGWMLMRNDYLIQLLMEYQAATDTESLDFQIFHRLKLATYLLDWALIAPGWGAIKTLAESVKDARQEGQKQSFLSLRSDWEPGLSSLAQLRSDFPSDTIIPGWEPLRMRDLVAFFDSEYNHYLALQIDRLLQAEEKHYDISKPPLLVRAQKDAAKLEMPARYTVAEANVAILDADKESFDKLIFAHPKTVAFLKSKRKEGDTFDPLHLAPGKPGEVYLWIFPSFIDLIAKVKGIDEFNRVIYRARLPKGASMPANPNLDPIEAMKEGPWWDEYRKAVKTLEGNDADVVSGEAELADILRGDRQTDLELVEARMMTASILDRTTRIQQLYRPLMEGYDRYEQFDKLTINTSKGPAKILKYEIPISVLKGAETVAQATGPRRYQPFHQAAFLLELADLLLDKLSVNPRMDVVVGYLPVLDDVLATVKSNPAMLAEILTPTEKADPVWLAQRTAAISKLAEKMRTITIDEQSRFGFIARKDADGDSILGIGEGYGIKVDDPFTIGALFETGATTWKLKRVAQNFIYHPAFGPAKPRVILTDANGDPQRELTESEKAGQLLLEMEISEGGNDMEGKKKPGVRTKIFAKDADILARLSYAVTMEAIIRQLNDLAAFIETAAEWTVEIVELLPGAGQLAMAAHLVIGIIEFLASPEFKVLRDELFDHPGKLISQGIDILSQLFNPMQLWEYLLFASNPFDRLHDVDQEPPQGKLLKQSGSSSIGGRIKAILVSLYHLGKRLLGFTGRLQTKVRWEAEAIQEWVIEKPLLAAFLYLVANHIDEIALVVSGSLDAYGAVDDTQKKIESELEDWPKQVIGLVNTLQQLELPNEIIPMWQVYAIITDLVLSRLGAKFRIAGKAIMWLLAKTGKDQVVFNAVNNAITSVNKNLDLNAIWRGLIKDKLEAPLKSARKELAVDIFGILAEVPLLSDSTKSKFTTAKSAAASETSEIKPQLVEEDELAAYPLSSPRDLAPVALPREAGAPLPPPDRRSAETRFGHDFAHVRVHQGAEAKRATREAGAAALTSGSNVYLGSGVSASSEIFDHELTHVLQQTGPRPLGRRYDAAPVSGRAKTGIRYDPAAESAANRTARQVRSRRSGTPIDPGPSATAGAQPGLLVTITRRFLEEVSQTGGAEHTEEREDRAHLRQTPENVQKQVSEVWGTFQSALKSLKAKGPFGDTSKQIPDEIRKYLLSESGDDGGIGAAIKHAVSDLAGDSMDEIKPAKGSKQKNVTYKLNIKRFRVAFERYILGKSGVALSIDFAKLASDDDLAKVTGVAVEYIYLQIVHGGRTLWKKAVEDLPRLKDPKERTKWLPRLRTHLAGLGPSPGVWEKTRYSLKDEILTKVIDEAGKSKLIDPNDLPPPAQYLAPKGSATGQLGHIGLRVGTYSEKGEGGSQNGTERESHHITQYLLLEYFNNKSSGVPAFPLLKSDVNPYPGLSAPSGVVEQFQSGSKPPLQLKKFEDKRGGEMPAILLSRITHRTAGLHVTSKADDFKDENVDSPATAINAIFRENLATASGPSQADKGVYLDAQKDLASFRKYKAAVGPTKIEDTIYTAMQETYKWMKNYMQPRLKDGLERVEAKYYNALAEEVGKPTITAGELAEVWAFAVSHNNKVMSSAGFKD